MAAQRSSRRALVRPPAVRETMACGVPTCPARLESDDAFEHEAVELSAVLDVGLGIPEVGLLQVFGLGHDARGDEPAAADFIPARSHVPGHTGELSRGPVVAGTHEQLLVAGEAVDPIDRVLSPSAFSRLGRGLTLCLFENAKQLEAAELHEGVHL